MTRLHKNLFSFLVIAILLFSAGMFCACGKKNKIVVTTTGSGTVTKREEKDGSYYVAIPDKWNDFVGWYDGNNKIGDQLELKITKSIPSNIVAKFASSGLQSANRTLEALYNNYILGGEMPGNCYEINTDFQFNYQDAERVLEDAGQFNGIISFNGDGARLSFNTNKIEIAYTDDTQNANLYVNNDGKMSTYKGLSLISSIWKELKDYSETWTIENVFNAELQRFFKTNLDYRNMLGIVTNAENDTSKTILKLNLSRILTPLKNNLTLNNQNPLISKVIEILTKHYKLTVIPDVILGFHIDYENKNDRECIKNVNISIDIPRTYYLTLDDKEVPIPKSQIDINFDNIRYQFVDKTLPEKNFDDYPVPDNRLLNFNIDGNMYLKNSTNIIDNYSIQLFSDLNPTALLVGDGDLHKVDWDNLGFLNFKISLIDDATEEGRALQEAKHKNSKDYINILIDSKRYGSKALVYIGLYQPESIFTLNYYVNQSFDLSEMANLSILQSDEKLQQMDKIKNYIYQLLLNLLDSSIKLKNGAQSDDVITEFMLGFLGEKASEVLMENLIEDGYGKTFNLQNIRNEIKNYEEESIKEYMSLYLPINLDELLFGSADEITQIAFKFNNIEKNTVISNKNGEYFDKNGQNLVNLYNNAHKTIVSVTGEIPSLKEESFTIQEIEELKNRTVTATEIQYSDGTKETKFTNNKGLKEEINLIVIKVEIEKEEQGKATCKFLLQIKDEPMMNGTSSFGELLYKLTGIPYGLFTYQTQLTLK